MTGSANGLGKLWRWRYLVARRLTQFGVLLLFFGTLRWGWSVAGSPVLRGNLSAAELLDAIPLADPFAVVQILLSGHSLEGRVLLGGLIVLSLYGLLGGRSFCAWSCPINPVTDLANWTRRRLGLNQQVKPDRRLRYWVFALALVLAPVTGVAAFEWISPIGMVHRGVLYGVGLGWVAVAGVFLFDLLVLRHGWCGHLCPLGTFYGLLGRAAQVRVAFDKDSCTRCGECLVACPEPQVLNFTEAAARGMIAPGDCTNCGRCIPVCPEGSLSFDWRVRIRSTRRRFARTRARRAS